jgi:hypothetical protein
VTEPTWKDPLLAEWWEGCSEETRETLKYSDRTMTPMNAYYSAALQLRSDDVDKLFHLIDAELARGRGARGVARQWADISDDDNRDGARHVARLILEAFDGE